LYILAKEYSKRKKLPFEATLEDFTGKLEEVTPQKQPSEN
jgi:hypothetical protein